MDIFTIIKANIKARKGQFIGLVLLVIFCVSSIVAFYNVMQSSRLTRPCDIPTSMAPDRLLIILPGTLRIGLYSRTVVYIISSSVNKAASDGVL